LVVADCQGVAGSPVALTERLSEHRVLEHRLLEYRGLEY
jgi:hypothetical protein